jgi:glycosyltransferase involved in cell wall biosynthesis
VILSDTRGLWDRDRMVDGETCVLVPPGDVRAMRYAIDRLMNDRALAARIGRNARTLVERAYGAKLFGHRVQALIVDVLGRARPGHNS